MGCGHVLILPDGPSGPSVIKKILIQKQTGNSVRKLVEEQMNLGISIVNLDKVAIAISLRNWQQKLKGLDVHQYPEHSSAKYQNIG